MNCSADKVAHLFFKLLIEFEICAFPYTLIFQASQFLQLMLIAANTRDHFAKQQILLHLYKKYLAKKDLCVWSKHFKYLSSSSIQENLITCCRKDMSECIKRYTGVGIWSCEGNMIYLANRYRICNKRQHAEAA